MPDKTRTGPPPCIHTYTFVGRSRKKLEGGNFRIHSIFIEAELVPVTMCGKEKAKPNNGKNVNIIVCTSLGDVHTACVKPENIHLQIEKDAHGNPLRICLDITIPQTA
jgi:hypothetical protein